MLGPAEVHVWVSELSWFTGALDRFVGILDPAEMERASHFRFAKDRDNFVVCRGVLRCLLGRYLELTPERIPFRYSPYGKPFLDAGSAGWALQFNLSHSGGVALFAIAAGMRVGVDVERVRADFGTREIAQRFFAPEEVAALDSLASAERSEAFFSCWTRKEAYLKARGEGLAVPLKSFAVSLASGDPPALLRCKDAEEISRWSLWDLVPAPGYAGALAAETIGARPRLRTWSARALGMA